MPRQSEAQRYDVMDDGWSIEESKKVEVRVRGDASASSRSGADYILLRPPSLSLLDQQRPLDLYIPASTTSGCASTDTGRSRTIPPLVPDYIPAEVARHSGIIASRPHINIAQSNICAWRNGAAL